jgi:hypothetical protein
MPYVIILLYSDKKLKFLLIDMNEVILIKSVHLLISKNSVKFFCSKKDQGCTVIHCCVANHECVLEG